QPSPYGLIVLAVEPVGGDSTGAFVDEPGRDGVAKAVDGPVTDTMAGAVASAVGRGFHDFGCGNDAHPVVAAGAQRGQLRAFAGRNLVAQEVGAGAARDDDDGIGFPFDIGGERRRYVGYGLFNEPYVRVAGAGLLEDRDMPAA